MDNKIKNKYILLVFLLALFFMEPCAGAGEVNKSLKSEIKTEEWLVTSYKDPFMEWVNLGLGGGTHGGGMKLNLFALRMPHLVLTPLQVEVYYGAPGFWEGSRKFLFSAGINLQYPLVLDKNDRHELRFGLMPEFLMNSHGDKDLDESCGILCSYYDMKGQLGFGLSPNLSYIYRLMKYDSISSGISFLSVNLSTHISIYGTPFCTELFSDAKKAIYPWPGVFLTVGIGFGSLP